jgi:uncharacterized protein YbjQ (UPF0145 family)
MILVTSDTIPGKRIVKVLGLVRGSTIRGTHLGHDIIAFFRNLIGGEINDYTKIFAESREQALDRMVEDARQLHANAVVTVRFASASIARGAAEMLAYGTAVIVEDE